MLQSKNGRWYWEGGGWETLGDGRNGTFQEGDRIKINFRIEDAEACADEQGWCQAFVARRPTPDESMAKYTHSIYFRETKEKT